MKIITLESMFIIALETVVMRINALIFTKAFSNTFAKVLMFSFVFQTVSILGPLILSYFPKSYWQFLSNQI